MPRTIDPIKQRRYIRARKQGNGKGKSLKIAGYSTKTAEHHQNDLAVVRCGEDRIEKEFDKSKITIDYIIKDLEKAKQTAIDKGDIGNWIKVDELFGKYKQIWNDKGIQVNVSQSQGTEQKELKERTNKHRGIPDIVVSKDNKDL